MRAQPAAELTGKGLVRVGSFIAVPDVLRELGYDPRTVLAGGGFDVRLFDNAENLVTIAARGELIAHCAQAARCGHFGLLVGQRNGLHSLGLVGLLARYSPDVRTALANLVRYFHLHVRGASMSLEVRNGAAILRHQLHQAGNAASDHIADGSVAWLLNILHELCGHRLKPIEIRLDHGPAANLRPYRECFRVPLKFNAGQNAVVFPATWLDRAMPDVHADVRRLVQEKIDHLVARVGDDFPGQVRAVLQVSLQGGHAGLDHIAALLALHPRTLRRKLAAAGSSFQALLDEVRLDLARDLLGKPEPGINDIALTLQYSDARAFIRAFRRWTGQTPARWRAAARQPWPAEVRG